MERAHSIVLQVSLLWNLLQAWSNEEERGLFLCGALPIYAAHLQHLPHLRQTSVVSITCAVAVLGEVRVHGTRYSDKQRVSLDRQKMQ